MARLQRIRPCLWFDGQGEEAANFYVGIFPNSRILKISRYSDVGREVHGRAAGSVMTVDFELDGQRMLALNGGPQFKFNQAISLMVFCEDQREVDHYWERLGAGGDASKQACGWLEDKFGLAWQVVPEAMMTMLDDNSSAASQRAFAAMMDMKKLDIEALRRAYKG